MYGGGDDRLLHQQHITGDYGCTEPGEQQSGGEQPGRIPDRGGKLGGSGTDRADGAPSGLLERFRRSNRRYV